jgi:hypothetical protein
MDSHNDVAVDNENDTLVDNDDKGAYIKNTGVANVYSKAVTVYTIVIYHSQKENRWLVVF